MENTIEQRVNSSRGAAVWRAFTTVIWLAIALAFATFFLIDLQLDYSQLQQACIGPDCNWLAISSAEEAVLNEWGLSMLFYARSMVLMALTAVLVYWIIGGLIFWRQFGTRIGWTVSLSLFVIPIDMIADMDNVVANYPELTTPLIILSIISSIIFTAFVLLFPNGKFVPRWTAALLVILVIVEPFLNFAFNGVFFMVTNQVQIYLVIITLTFFLIVFGCQLYRYFRVSTPSERLQTKWVLFGFIVMFLGFPVWIAFYGDLVTFAPGTPRLLASAVGWLIVLLMATTLPVTIAISISRYNLWNIDRIIRGSLIYALLTGSLLLVFYGSVLTLQSLFGTLLGGEQGQLIIVLSTLLVAALLNPLRGRIQSLIDRRFYRKKYDAQLALAQFGATLSSEVEDMAGIETLLLQVLDETIQPKEATVWLADLPES